MGPILGKIDPKKGHLVKIKKVFRFWHRACIYSKYYVIDYYINLPKIEQTAEGQWTCQQAGKTIKTIQLSVDGKLTF